MSNIIPTSQLLISGLFMDLFTQKSPEEEKTEKSKTPAKSNNKSLKSKDTKVAGSKEKILKRIILMSRKVFI